VQTLKRQLKDAKDTVQKQRVEIENLKSKLDMSVSKLTGTEKALSEALREYKQDKEKFLKLSSDWNRKIKTLEGQVQLHLQQFKLSFIFTSLLHFGAVKHFQRQLRMSSLVATVKALPVRHLLTSCR
jgi:predicted RNase H-like nuclease (RuvC/YqgF family)